MTLGGQKRSAERVEACELLTEDEGVHLVGAS